MSQSAAFRSPLRFRPVYKVLVWGGRRMERWRDDLPAGPVGESWDLADHPDGMSVVADGPLAGRTLTDLMATDARALVGAGHRDGSFPLMVKLIDAAERLSVQVHPDDHLARTLGVGKNGKTECWLVLSDGGAIYQGTGAGVDRAAFERALAGGTVEQTLNRFEPKAGEFFFLEARTVHALGAGCLVYEIQQTSNVTFRVHDWGRLGLDGKPRPMHVAEALQTIAFDRTGFGPRRPPWSPHAGDAQGRVLVDCPYFRVEEWRGRALGGAVGDRCAIVTCVEGEGELATAGGAMRLRAMQTALVPAAAGAWKFDGAGTGRVLVSEPR